MQPALDTSDAGESSAPDEEHIFCSLQTAATEEIRYFASLEELAAFIRSRYRSSDARANR